MSERPDPVKRLYVISDTAMLENCETAAQLFNTDLALFTAFDANFNAAYRTSWLTGINDARNFITDELYRDQMSGKSADVEAQMKLSRKKYNEIKYFVLKAFPENAAVQQEFGLDDYDDARRTDIKLQEFMLRLHATATKYTAELTAAPVGYTPQKIAEISALAGTLGTRNTDQEVFIANQGTTTQDRINKMNLVWVKRQQIAAAAKIIFETNYAKYQQYILPPSEAPASDFSITGTVTAQSTNQPIVGAQAKIVQLNSTVLTDEFGKYGFADNVAAGTYTLEISAPGFQTFSTQVVITSADETVVVNAALVV